MYIRNAVEAKMTYLRNPAIVALNAGTASPQLQAAAANRRQQLLNQFMDNRARIEAQQDLFEEEEDEDDMMMPRSLAPQRDT